MRIIIIDNVAPICNVYTQFVLTRVPTRPGKPGKPGKMRVHLENLEISWKNDMQPGKTLWLLKIHPGLPNLETLLYNV